MSSLLARLNKEVLTGLVFLAFGAALLWFGRSYELGAAARPGPGYLPMLLGWLLVALGVLIVAKGIVRGGEALEGWAWRSLFLVCASFILFAVLIKPAGLIVTAIVCMLTAGAASNEFHLREQIIFAVIAATVAAIGFAWALEIPMELWPEFLR